MPSFSHVFWIDASSIGTITQELRGICNLPEAQSSALDGSPQSALWWISSLGENYAMVFDNADNLTPEELEQYFPSGLGGNILITSRNSGLKHLTLHESSFEVKEMEENDAISLLLKAACLDESREDLQAEASKIVNELFCIPLAIDQAGAFIAFGDTDIRDYLDEYSQYRERLLSYPAFKGASKYNRSVYGTWELSFKEIQQRAKSGDSQRAEAANSAMILLAIFAFLHFDGITEEIFSYAAMQRHGKSGHNEHRSALPLASSSMDHTLLQLHDTGKWDNFTFKEGLRVLLSFSLIELVSSKGIYNMHPLIHAWGRDRMSSEDRQKYCLMAFIILACSLPEDFDEQPYQFRRVLVTHLRANIMHSVMSKKEMDNMYYDDAYEKFGRMLSEQGYDSEAEKFQIQVLDARSRSLGEEHPGTISAMGDLAITYKNLGKYGHAERLQIQVLHMRKTLLGEEHSNTITAMGYLASTYDRLGKYADAEKLKIDVLNLRNRLLGEEHPDTITAMNNLANTYQNLGKYADAEKLQIQVLYIGNKLLREEHPGTITAKSNLAITYDRLGKYADAETLKIDVLKLRKRLLGEEHPDTITAMSNLAITYDRLTKYADAETLKIDVLNLRRRLLGEEHPDTITAMHNLAYTYQNLGKYTDAEKLQIPVLHKRKELLGEEHPGTITAMSNLAITYDKLGKYADAGHLKIGVLNLRKRLLGEEHPDTITVMSNLAITYDRLRKYADAKKLKIDVLNLRKRLLGEEHPETITAMSNLAITYDRLRKYADAEKLKVNVLNLRDRLLGGEHRDTITAMSNLAITYDRLGKYAAAEKLKFDVLNLRKRILGEQHPDTITAMGNLAITYDRLGKYADAEILKTNVRNLRSQCPPLQQSVGHLSSMLEPTEASKGSALAPPLPSLKDQKWQWTKETLPAPSPPAPQLPALNDPEWGWTREGLPASPLPFGPPSTPVANPTKRPTNNPEVEESPSKKAKMSHTGTVATKGSHSTCQEHAPSTSCNLIPAAIVKQEPDGQR